MKAHIIWSNYDINIDDYQDFLNDFYPDVTDEFEKYQLCAELNDEYFDDARVNLNIILPTEIIIIGDLGFWNGRVNGYKELHSCNLSDCLRNENDCDYAEFYVDEYKNLRSRQSHHDGTNYFLYRRWKEDISDEQKENFLNKIYYNKLKRSDISRYTESVGKMVAEIYGW